MTKMIRLRTCATPLTIGALLLMSATGVLMFFGWDRALTRREEGRPAGWKSDAAPMKSTLLATDTLAASWTIGSKPNANSG
jgi:hypothetical protein